MKHRPHTDRETPPSLEELRFARRHVKGLVAAGAIFADDAGNRIGSLEWWADGGPRPGDWVFTDLCLWGAFRPLPRESVVLVFGEEEDDGGALKSPPPNVDYRALMVLGARSRRSVVRARGRCSLVPTGPRNMTARRR